MPSIYALKGRFQNLLRPTVRRLHGRGVTANQVTLAAAGISLLVGLLVGTLADWASALFVLLPLWLFLRMAMNAIDGMLAREFGQASRLGACLNELGDLVADAALYLALLAATGVVGWLLGLFVWLAALTEAAGLLGPIIGSRRRYEGPMGKSDRAFLIGLLGLLLAGDWIDPTLLNATLALACLLCILTCVRRVRAALASPISAA